MIKEIKLNEKIIKYDLQYKRVKNINLRIKPDGSVHVSANRFHSQKLIESFLTSKADFITNALEKYEIRAQKPRHQYFSDDEITSIILELCEKIYPYFEEKGVGFPSIKFKPMVSQWGNCHYKKGVLNFSTNLRYAPIECIEYVVAHEFTHFLHPDHSINFYNELSKIMPDYKQRRQKLKEISIRK